MGMSKVIGRAEELERKFLGLTVNGFWRGISFESLNVTFDDDGSEVEWENFDLCKLEKITLKYNRKTREVSADEE